MSPRDTSPRGNHALIMDDGVMFSFTYRWELDPRLFEDSEEVNMSRIIQKFHLIFGLRWFVLYWYNSGASTKHDHNREKI